MAAELLPSSLAPPFFITLFPSELVVAPYFIQRKNFFYALAKPFLTAISIIQHCFHSKSALEIVLLYPLFLSLKDYLPFELAFTKFSRRVDEF